VRAKLAQRLGCEESPNAASDAKI